MSNFERAERFTRDQLERIDGMERDAKLLQDGGLPKQSEKLIRDTAKLRRLYERDLAAMPARRAESEARAGAMLGDIIAEIERTLAAHEAGVDGMAASERPGDTPA